MDAQEAKQARNDKARFDFMTVSEVADILRVGRAKMYRMLQNGEIPGKKIGCEWRISRLELESFLAQQSNQAERR